MSALKFLSLVVALLGVWSAGEARAETYVVRQYYSSWRPYPGQRYFYRTYYYKPTPAYVGYRHHYVIYFPQRPRYAYYYNPYKRVYWGRFQMCDGGMPTYSLQTHADRKPVLDQIPEKAFPKPGAMPPVPESQPGKGVAMEPPPDDLPSLESLPTVGK